MNNYIIIISFIVLLITLSKIKSSYRGILFLAFVLRLAILYIDRFQIFEIPFTGNDTENFHYFTLRSLEGDDVRLTYYTVFLTWIYKFFANPDDGRFMSQFINVLFSYGIVYYICRSLSELNVSGKKIVIAVTIVTFMPVLLCFSAVLLREAWCEFFVTISVYFMIVWYKRNSLIHLIAAFISVLLAMIMHAGCIGLLFGYLLAVFGYRKGIRQRPFNYILSLIMITTIVMIVISDSELFLGKFTRTLESEEFYLDKNIAIRKGGSSYLLWLEGKSTVVGLLFTPLKIFYFLFSPMPWNWRDLMDVFVFVVDSTIYLFFFYHAFRIIGGKKKRNRMISRFSNQNVNSTHLYDIRKYLLYGIFFTTFIFSISLFNTGTAIRHRAKIIPVVAIAYAISSELRSQNRLSQMKKLKGRKMLTR